MKVTSESLVSESLACFNHLFENSEIICNALLLKIGKKASDDNEITDPDAVLNSTLTVLNTVSKNLKQLL